MTDFVATTSTGEPGDIRPGFDESELHPPGRILHFLMMVLGTDEAALCQALDISRQSMNRRRRGLVDQQFAELVEVARFLDVPVQLFAGQVQQALIWVLTNQPGRLDSLAQVQDSPRGNRDRNPVKRADSAATEMHNHCCILESGRRYGFGLGCRNRNSAVRGWVK